MGHTAATYSPATLQPNFYTTQTLQQQQQQHHQHLNVTMPNNINSSNIGSKVTTASNVSTPSPQHQQPSQIHSNHQPQISTNHLINLPNTNNNYMINNSFHKQENSIVSAGSMNNLCSDTNTTSSGNNCNFNKLINTC